MGRNKKDESSKKKTISITLDSDLLVKLEEIGVNKSELINSLLVEYLTNDR